MRDAQAPCEGVDAFISCEERVKESNGSDEMNNERNIEKKVNCKLCGEEIDNPLDDEIQDLLYQFVALNVSANTTLEEQK